MTMENHFNKEFNVIYLRVVQGCNLNCTHCFTLGNRDKYEMAPLKNVESFLSSIRKHVNPAKAVVYIHGGEPFLAPLSYHREVNSCVRATLRDTKIDIIPQTNLMYKVDQEYIDFIKSEYNGQLGVSWDHKIRFESTTRGLNEDLFFTNFRTLVDAGIDMAVAITVQRHLLQEDPVVVAKKFSGAKSLDFEFLTYFDDKTRDLKVKNHEWSEFYLKLVQFYSENATSWSMPLVDLFTKSIAENKIYQCKCNCCQHRTFTMNCNGTVGLCPDETYFDPISTITEMANDWPAFTKKAQERHLNQLVKPLLPLCGSCEYYDFCGGNCETALFEPGDIECPMSKKTLKYQFENINTFKAKLKLAYENLPELKD